METRIKRILRKWRKVILEDGLLNPISMSREYSQINSFIKISSDKELEKLVRDCRDYSLGIDCKASILLIKIDNVLNYKKKEGTDKKNSLNSSVTQRALYCNTTKVIFNEPVRFLDGILLRNFDISMEYGEKSRKVKKIVEKRMCQAYHRKHRECFRNEDNKRRHEMRRAVSFQLHNIGQIENLSDFPRTYSTHWKKMYDMNTKQYVLKKKMSYSNMGDANKAIILWNIKHPEDKRGMHVYQCAYCGKYHIGHERTELVNTEYAM